MAKQFGKKADGRNGLERASERWIDQELAGCEFQDERLTKRFEKLFRQLSGGIGQSISMGLPGLDKHQGRLSVLR